MVVVVAESIERLILVKERQNEKKLHSGGNAETNIYIYIISTWWLTILERLNGNGLPFYLHLIHFHESLINFSQTIYPSGERLKIMLGCGKSVRLIFRCSNRYLISKHAYFGHVLQKTFFIRLHHGECAYRHLDYQILVSSCKYVEFKRASLGRMDAKKENTRWPVNILHVYCCDFISEFIFWCVFFFFWYLHLLSLPLPSNFLYTCLISLIVICRFTQNCGLWWFSFLFQSMTVLIYYF